MLNGEVREVSSCEGAVPGLSVPESDVAFIGRQPIIATGGGIHGYDLLFRGSATSDCAAFGDAVQATARVIVDVFGSFGADAMLGSAIGFLHADSELQICEFITALPRERVVVGIHKLECVTPEFAQRVKDLYHDGVHLCLDNFVHRDPRSDLLRHVRYARVDVTHQNRMELRKVLRLLRQHGVTAIAGRVETREQHALVEKLGYDLVQGYYFARPEVMAKPRIITRRTQLLSLIAKIQDTTTCDEIASWIREVPQLNLHLLNLVRCISLTPGTRIESLRQAIVMIGQKELKHWLNLLLYAADGEDGLQNPLCAHAVARSKSMEGLARIRARRVQNQEVDEECAGLTGMLSLAAPLFHIEVGDFVADLPIPAEMRAALLKHEGWLGQLLALHESIDEDDLPAVDRLLGGLDLTRNDLESCQIEALSWANKLQSAPSAAPMGSGVHRHSLGQAR